MNIFDDIYHKEQLTCKRHYEYRCLFCKTKRKTAKRKIAEGRMCNACQRVKIEEAFDKKQMKLFI